MHLVNGFTWEQVEMQFEEQHGRQNGYSKRTYERLQQKDLKQLVEVMENSEIDNLVSYIMFRFKKYCLYDEVLTLYCHYAYTRLETADDVDWFKVNVRSGYRYVAALKNVWTTQVRDMTLYYRDSDGTWWYISAKNKIERQTIFHFMTEADTYYIRSLENRHQGVSMMTAQIGLPLNQMEQ